MNLCNADEIKKIMSKYQTGAKKGFGQNFLIDKEIPERIAEESFCYHKEICGEGESCVLEIGPGIGALTKELCKRYGKVSAIEIDKSLIPILGETLSDCDNVNIINEDFMKLNLRDFLTGSFGKNRVSVCANLPYYITTPIIMKLLEETSKAGDNRIVSVTVMVQREVARRICATCKDSEYGAITASINYYGEAKMLFDVTPECFLPAPSITSTVIRIELYKEKKYKVKNEELLFDVIAGAFAQRRKTMANSLSSSFPQISKAEICEIIKSSGFDVNIRGERMDIGDFCNLADKFNEVLLK